MFNLFTNNDGYDVRENFLNKYLTEALVEKPRYCSLRILWLEASVSFLVSLLLAVKLSEQLSSFYIIFIWLPLVKGEGRGLSVLNITWKAILQRVFLPLKLTSLLTWTECYFQVYLRKQQRTVKSNILFIHLFCDERGILMILNLFCLFKQTH